MRHIGWIVKSLSPGAIPVLAVLCALSLLACAGTANRTRATELAIPAGFAPVRLSAGPFTLHGFVKSGPGSVLDVYIEGDGLAWATRTRPSSDPTPDDPVALRLAILDPSPKVLYLGRPCQYDPSGPPRDCDVRYWTSHRYAPEVIAAMNAALDQAKALTTATTLRLFGYSGGGAVAVLAAAGRSDVVLLATIAGNLDTEAWTRHHNVTPLSGSLNPAAARLPRTLPQVHFVGENDRVMPAAVARSYLSKAGPDANIRIVTVPGMNHADWPGQWPSLLER